MYRYLRHREHQAMAARISAHERIWGLAATVRVPMPADTQSLLRSSTESFTIIMVMAS